MNSGIQLLFFISHTLKGVNNLKITNLSQLQQIIKNANKNIICLIIQNEFEWILKNELIYQQRALITHEETYNLI